jgi:hypothetical protein
MGAKDYLAKPIDEAVPRRTIASVIRYEACSLEPDAAKYRLRAWGPLDACWLMGPRSNSGRRPLLAASFG